MSTLTKKINSTELFHKYIAAIEKGDEDAAMKIGAQLPLAPHIAAFAKSKLTPAEITELGLDVSAAD